MIANIENAFKFVFRDKHCIVKILIGGILAVIPVINFIVFGYVLTILKDAKEGKTAFLPALEEWGKLFKEGFIVFVISVVYGLIILAIWLVATIVSLVPIIGCLSILLFPVFVAALVLLSPAINLSLCKYLDKGLLQEAFNLKEIYEEFKSKLNDYLIVTLINAGITSIAFMTFCAAPFIYFWLWVITGRLFGEIYGTRPTKIGL